MNRVNVSFVELRIWQKGKLVYKRVTTVIPPGMT